MMAETLGRGSGRSWNYDVSEIVADGVVHGLGLLLAVVGCIALFGFELREGGLARIGAHAVYGVCLLVTLSASAAYNMWPVSPLKWALRRVDHAMIFALIAGTYTPFLVHADRNETTILLIGIWLVSLVGMVLKGFTSDGHEWLSTGLYIALGWSGILVLGSIVGTMPATSLVLLITGGLLYSGGVAFHHWRSLRFQNAIWHSFVLAGASTHFTAVLIASHAP